MKWLNLDANDAILIVDEKQRRYFTGFDSSFGYLALTAGHAAFFTDMRYLLAARERIVDAEVMKFEGLDAVAKYFKERGVSKVGIDYSLTTVSEFENLKKTGLEFYDAGEILRRKFAVKTSAEIAAVSAACNIAQRAYLSLLPLINAGVTEKKFANELEHIMHVFGAEKPSFDTIVAFGANTAVPHHKPDDTPLCDNMPVLVDFGCVYDGYCSDCTRTFYFGRADSEFRRAYDAVAEANEAAENTIVSGCDAAEAHASAVEVLKKYGMDGAFTHSLGHGIGVNIHEYPYLSPRGNGVKLTDGMVFSIEPGVYFDNKFGIRIEDTVVLEKGKVRRLFGDDKNLKEIY